MPLAHGRQNLKATVPVTTDGKCEPRSPSANTGTVTAVCSHEYHAGTLKTAVDIDRPGPVLTFKGLRSRCLSALPTDALLLWHVLRHYGHERMPIVHASVKGYHG